MTMQGAAQRPGGPSPNALGVIYVALIIGVVLFALIVRLVFQPVGTYSGPALRYGWLAAAAACTLAAGYFRTRLASPGADSGQLTTAAVIVWALAEGQALLGIVAYMLSGDVLVFWCALVLFAYLFARYRPAVFRAMEPR
jgi:F0F1-type ATP synthase membrane subunit c/vacuolar-type H+-ATPase subunit K